ncbi:choice-of-anchor A family protein [Singulisphaera sp. Ch08]|uniref:Choice-of-anchor A family protein n=1 Tax=Singulisphaera sp. Ch08 TaxID=3120278 RepID=A0AAU7C8V6_9BACT
MGLMLGSTRDFFSATFTSILGGRDRGPDRGRRRSNRRALTFDFMELRELLAALGAATPFNFFIFDAMNEANSDVEGRLAVGGPLSLMNFSVASAFQGANGGRGADNALVSGTSLTFTNGQINGDLHYRGAPPDLTGVGVTGTIFPNSTPVDFAAARTSLTEYSAFLGTIPPSGSVSVSTSGSTLTLNGNPASALNIFNLTAGQIAATRDGRLNITNVSPTATVLINVSGASIDFTRVNFEYNGVAGRQSFATQILYNLFQATTLNIESASPLGSILAPRAAVTQEVGGAHINGTLIASSLAGFLEGHDYPFEGELPPLGEPEAEADVALSKTASTLTPRPNGAVTFTITLTNLGPDLAQNVVVADLLPAGVTLDSVTVSQGTYDAELGIWDAGNVAVGSPLTLTLVTTVTTCEPVSNLARIIGSETTDPNPGNDASGVTITPYQTDLSLAKTVDDATPTVGDTFTYTVTVTNLGPNAAEGVAVSDRLPSGLTFVSAAPSQGSVDLATSRWLVGTLAPGSSATLLVRVTATSAGRKINNAVVVASDIDDCNPANNIASTVVNVEGPVIPPLEEADVALSKTASTLTPRPNGAVTFTITLTNLGPDLAQNVVVADLLPAGVNLDSVTVSQGTYDAELGIWDAGNVAVGSPLTLTLVTTVTTCEPVSNLARIIGSETTDPNPGNDASGVTITPYQTDLSLAKTVDDATPTVGDTFTYTVTVTVTVTNLGPNAAEGVAVSDRLPSGLTFVSAAPSQGSVDLATSRWLVGTLAPGSSATLLVRVTATSAGRKINNAVVVASDIDDCNPANNIASIVVNVQAVDSNIVVPPTLVDVERIGVHHQPTTLVLTFGSALDPVQAEDVTNYRVIRLIHGKIPGPSVRVTSAVYSPESNTVTLTFARRLSLFARYRLIVNGDPLTGLSTPTAVLLDGRGIGEPGIDAVRGVNGHNFRGRSQRPRQARLAARERRGALGTGHSLAVHQRSFSNLLPKELAVGQLQSGSPRGGPHAR